MNLYQKVTAAVLATAALLVGTTLWADSTPVIKTFTVQQVKELKPGTALVFKLSGSTGADVTLQLDGSARSVVMSETKAGSYEGAYTLGLRDQVTHTSQVRATLRLDNQETQAVLGQTLLTASAQKAAVAAAGKTAAQTVSTRQTCDTCGVLQSVNVVEVKGEPGYGGMIAGGVAGALLGSQIGKGDGRTAASVLGAAGGAYAGREVEKNLKKEKRYDVTVRLNNGTLQTVHMKNDPGLKVGAQVKIVGDSVVTND